MIPIKYSQLTKRLPYEKGKELFEKKVPYLEEKAALAHKIVHKKEISTEEKYQYHLGQLKLFYSEMLFLNKWAKDGNIVLYVGAAEGYHTLKLSELFPKLFFELWDPRKFDPGFIGKKNIKTYNQFFTNDDAKKYTDEGNNILFMCDIRTMKTTQVKKGESWEYLVEDDMKMQENWVKIINPISAYLKFRLPREVVPIMQYLSGTIYLQPYAPLSTETRLMTTNYHKEIEYDVVEFDEKMAYFNFIIRQHIKSKKWKKIMEKYKIINNWDNTFALYITQEYLKKMNKNASKENTVSLFLEIIAYHRKKYGSRYDIIFNK